MKDEASLSFEEAQMLAWKAGGSLTCPWSGALPALQAKGLVSAGNILSAKITEKGHALLAEREGK